MGFYNFYRLLKEIRYFFKDKTMKRLLTICIIALLTVIILHTQGYCATPNYNIFPPYHNTDYYTEMLIRPIGTSIDMYFNYNNFTLGHDTNQNKNGWYFEMVQGWTYFIVNNSGSPMNWCTTSDVPSPGVSFSAFNTNQNNQTYYLISDQGGSGYCYFYTNDTSATFTVYAYCFDQYMYLDKSTAEYYLNSINSWVYQLKTQNNQNLNDIKQMLHDYIYGDSSKTEYDISSQSVNDIFITNSNAFGTISNCKTIYFPIKNGYNYKFTYNLNFNNPQQPCLRYGTTTNIPTSGVSGVIINSVWNNTTGTDFNYTATFDGYFFFCFRSIDTGSYGVSCVSNYNESQELGLSQTIINNNNNNTQIIDNTLTNSDISVEDNQLVTDNTQDITQDGYNNIFEMIRTAFTGSPSAITFPIPFVNQSFTLQPDFLSHYLQVGGLGFFVTLMSAYWYFVVSRYIVKRIYVIIENLKSGELEQTTGNIKTEVF